MMAAVVVVSVVAVVVVDVVAAWRATSASGSTSSSATASASTLSCFRVFGTFLGVFGSCSFFFSWSIGFGIFFIFSISGIGGILRCIVIWRFLLLSLVTSCRSISLWAIASGVSWFGSIIGCILVSLHVGN